MKFFIGTTNPDKIREIGGILTATGHELTPTHPVDPEETEDDFEGNALLKARVYAKHAGGWTISEDSGLVIPALGGLPGPWSARFADCQVSMKLNRVTGYAPSGRSPEEIVRRNNDLVLRMLSGMPAAKRAASFKAVVAVAVPDGRILFKAVGEAHGRIAEQARGTSSFGYDPIFIGEDAPDKTYAELTPSEKNAKSHRRQALDAFVAWLKTVDRAALA